MALILDAPTSISSTLVFPAISAGSNRLAWCYVAKVAGSGNVSRATSVTLGGVQMTFVAGPDTGNHPRVAGAWWVLNESEIASMVGSDVVVGGGSGAATSVVAMSTKDSSQSIPTNINEETGVSAAASGALSLIRDDDSVTLSALVTAVNAAYSTTNPATSLDLSENSKRISIGHQTDSSNTSNWSWNGTNTYYSSSVINIPTAVTTTTETLDNVTLEPAAGKQYVTIGATPDLSYKSLLYGTDPSASNPDQLEADTLTSDGKAITLDDTGKFVVDNVGTNVQTFQYRIYDADGDGWSAMATATVTPEVGSGRVLTTWDNISYSLRSYVRKVVFHSKLIITTRGRAEETILHDAMVTLGGTGMTPPIDGVVPEPGWLGTQAVSEFEKRIAKLPTTQEAAVILDITTHLTALGWT